MSKEQVIIVGSGNAAICPGIAALEAGAKVSVALDVGAELFGKTSGAVFGRLAGQSAAAP